MNIHHKNMREVSGKMHDWVSKNLSAYGIYECNYARYEINNKQWMTMPTFYEWHAEYLEKQHDDSIEQRLHEGINHWDLTSPIFNDYQNFIQKRNKQYLSSYNHKIDYVKKHADVYEVLVIGTNQALTMSAYHAIEKSMHELSYQAHKIIKKHRNVMLPIENKIIGQKTDNNCAQDQPYNPYSKSMFDQLILTAKELLYIEYALLGYTHKHIAYMHQCTVTAVRNIYLNIRLKMGNANMPAIEMMEKLKALGVLAVCSARLHANT